MVKKAPLTRILFCLTAMALVGVTALALGSRHDIVTSSDGRQATAMKGPSIITPREVESGAPLATIAGNLSDFPFGVFFCCFGNTVAGPTSSLGFEVWAAVPFTPSANMSVTKLQASVGYIISSDTKFILSLYNDASGLPGTPIKSFHATAGAAFGACCTLVTAHDAAGIPVTGGTQYWLVAKTNDKKDPTFFGAWAFNSTDMRTHPLAFYCKTTGSQCGSNNGIWVAGQGLVPGFGVFGH
jgi:hypothetical protein